MKARNEIERRGMYIDLLERSMTESSRDLAVLIKECLEFEPIQRPTAREALKRLEALQSAVHDPYTDLSRFQLMIALREREELVQQLVTEISASRVKMEFLEEQLKQTEVSKLAPWPPLSLSLLLLPLSLLVKIYDLLKYNRKNWRVFTESNKK